MAEIEEAAKYLKGQLPNGAPMPQVAIVCGSGLGGLAKTIDESCSVPYSDIPHFARVSVEGHVGKLVFGTLNGIPTVCMVGRFHYYEGYSMEQITFPIRVFSVLGVKTLIVTNASGSLNPKYKVGDVMIINDHINLIGMTGINPLIGPNLGNYGPRFPAMTETYKADLRSKLRQSALKASISADSIQEGVYVCIAGPNYESKAEARFLRTIGADAVGMSTVPEVLVARHCGLSVVGFSLITNIVIQSDDQPRIAPPSHAEVLAASKARERDLELFVWNFVGQMKAHTAHDETPNGHKQQ